MILFEQDWDLPENQYAIADTSTENTSWLRMAYMCRNKFKLKNWKWMLQLHNPNLVGVDPHSPTLNFVQKQWILAESAINPFYFIREVIRIPKKAGSGFDKVRVNRGDLATYWLFFNHVDTTNIQLRQTGKTIKMESTLIWLLTIGTSGNSFRYGTMDDNRRTKAIRDIKKTIQALPPYFQAFQPGVDADNSQVITCKSQDNIISFTIGQADKDRANQAGRGDTVAVQVWDEIAETKNIHIMIPASLGAGGAVIKEAKADGKPYGNIFACTAGSLDTTAGKFYNNLALEGLWWTEKLYDQPNQDELHNFITSNSISKIPRVNVAMSYGQLGISDEEFQERVARAATNDPDVIAREFYSRFTRGGSSNPLTKQQIAVIHQGEREPFKEEVVGSNYLFKWYVDPAKFHEVRFKGKLAICLDTSKGIGRDFCSVTFEDMRTLEVLARMDINQTNLDRYADWVASLIEEYPEAIFIIENKSSGQGIIDKCIIKCVELGLDIFKLFFNRVYQDIAKYEKIYEEIKSTPIHYRDIYWHDKYKKYLGFSTNAQLRQELYNDCLAIGVKSAGSLIRDASLSNQIRLLEKDKNGRINHPDKIRHPDGTEEQGHDDAVISWLLGIWFSTYGRNYAEYGIDPRLPKSLISESEDGSMDNDTLEKQKLRNELLDKLLELEEEFKTTTSPFALTRLESRMREYNGYLEMLGGESKNIDTLIDDLNKERKNKQLERMRVIA